MRLKRSAAIVLRQFYLVRNSISRLLSMFVWVMVDMVLWGFISRYFSTLTTAGFSLVPALLGAVLLWDFFIRVMQGITMAFFEDVWSRNFLNIFATPLSLGDYLLGLVFSSIATSAFGLLVMLLFACSIFGLSLFSYGAAIFPFMLVLFMFGIALGILASALVLRLGPSAEWFVWPIPALISPFAGVFYPLSTLPLWMRSVSAVLPPAYVFEALRSIVAGHGASMSALFIGLILAALYIVAACFVFAATFRRAVRTGLIARYSAETIS